MNVRRYWSLLGLLLLLPVSHAATSAARYGVGDYDGDYRGGQIVRCQSRDLRTEYCSIDGRYRARLVNQLSRGTCIEGRTWGQDGRGLWVSDGCRGEFALDDRGHGDYGNGYGGYGDWNAGRYDNYDRSRGAVVSCGSSGSRTVRCDADTRYGVRLIGQYSNNACVQGRTWGWDRRGIWTARGCRGRFALGGNGHDGGYADGYGGGNARGMSCQSQNNRYHFCRSNNYIRQAQIRRRLSDADCQYNWSWGYRSDGIWVDKGCRAEFAVY